MKLKSIILLLFFILPTIKTIAQDDIYEPLPVNYKQQQRKEKHKKYPKKINSGFFFINGKYIEPPYKFKTKNLMVSINDNVIMDYNQRINIGLNNEYLNIKEPIVPLWITKKSDINTMLDAIDSKTGKQYTTIAAMYYFTNFTYEKALKKLINYYISFPCVKSFTPISENKNNTMFKIFDYQGNSKIIDIATGMYNLNKKWGPNGVNKNKKNVIQKYTKYSKKTVEIYTNYLMDGDFLFINNEGLITTVIKKEDYNLILIIDSLKRNKITFNDYKKNNSKKISKIESLYKDYIVNPKVIKKLRIEKNNKNKHTYIKP